MISVRVIELFLSGAAITCTRPVRNRAYGKALQLAVRVFLGASSGSVRAISSPAHPACECGCVEASSTPSPWRGY